MSCRWEGNQRRRPRDNPSWYDKSMAAFADQDEDRIEIPKEKVGLVIGRKGSRLQDIREQTGVQITIKDNRAHLRGTAEQRQKAKKIIEEVLNPDSNKEGRWNQGGFKILHNLLVPQHLMGYALGKGRENLRNIETKTGAAIKVINNSFYIKNATEREEKLAEREIKASANVGMKRLQRGGIFTKFVHIDTTQLEDNHEFQLIIAPLPVTNAGLGENYYKLKLLEHPLQEETYRDFTNTNRIQEKVLEVLRQIHGDMGEEEVRVDMWCHFGHAYINKVDEEELEETFTLKEIKEKLETADTKTWESSFKEGVKEMEVAEIEKHLSSKAAKEDIRHDFTFYTPTCRDVRVKLVISWRSYIKYSKEYFIKYLNTEKVSKKLGSASFFSTNFQSVLRDPDLFLVLTDCLCYFYEKAWLMEADDRDEEVGDEASALAFCRSAPIPVKNILTRVQSVEQGDTSNTPCFHICTQFHGRMKADILIPSKDLDCRLLIRTCKNYVPKTPQDEEEDKILESYLMGMKIENGKLTLPPASELQDGFDLFFQRRSLRKTYQYEVEGEQFSLTVCKDQARNVCPYEPDTMDIEEQPAKADIHLHCEEWDRVLDEGNWEPEQIVAKLPTFLQFLRQVQTNVSP